MLCILDNSFTSTQSDEIRSPSKTDSKKSSGQSSEPALPLPDPGGLLDMIDSTDFLTFNNGGGGHAVQEVYAGSCDALIVYAAEANKKSDHIYFIFKLNLFRV